MSKYFGYLICFTQKVFEVFQKLVFSLVSRGLSTIQREWE